MRRLVKIAFRGLLVVIGLALVLAVAGLIIVRTDWFKNKIRAVGVGPI